MGASSPPPENRVELDRLSDPSILRHPGEHRPNVQDVNSLPQGLQGIRKPVPARRLERVAHVRALAGRTDAERPAATNGHEIIQAT